VHGTLCKVVFRLSVHDEGYMATQQAQSPSDLDRLPNVVALLLFRVLGEMQPVGNL
jgi:hypothetical protein